uniref:Tachylectin 2 domain-containing protein n=1 Tax=Leptobrachium leishanense TaxID=445787 RepID=A0A8C5PCD4_9ANUR
MEPTPDTILVAITKRPNICRAGLPPNHINDDYPARSTAVGKIDLVRRLAFSPAGELFATRGKDLYRGPMPSDPNADWFSTAKRVDTVDWDTIGIMLFHPDGTMYVVTNNGTFYKGPPPDNDKVSWMYQEATIVGQRFWETLHTVFFDNDGMLYAVTREGRLVARRPPVSAGDPWLSQAVIVGGGDWRNLCGFISFSPDGYLWCVNIKNGDCFRGLPPTRQDPPSRQDPNSYIKNAQQLGRNYNRFPIFAFTIDRMMKSILSFEFLPDLGEVLSLDTEVMYTQVYTNSSSTTLYHTFSFSETVTETSTFSQQHGFTVAFGAEMHFKAGIPILLEYETKISIDMSTTHTWTLTETNTVQRTFTSSTKVVVPAKSSIRMTATIQKGQMNVPYRAKIRTMFGSEAFIEGIWKGVTYYHLMVSQEDYRPQHDSDIAEDYTDLA